MKKTVQFSSAPVTFYFDVAFAKLRDVLDPASAIILTDENIFSKHKKYLKEFQVIVMPAGEANKTQKTVDHIILQLIEAGADRNTTLIGLGGGVVTDITGYVAGIYMRGISFGFVPTTILAMVDAAIGGKNGIDVGVYKNIAGLIRQPSFIWYDYNLLSTLPNEEWINGFAEVIKHACIKDRKMFVALQQQKLSFWKRDRVSLAKLIRQNVDIKVKVVQQDEFEKADRKLLNFGHTFGHAIENLYGIPHGHSISIGMGIACKISEKLAGFKETESILQLLKQYGLPPSFAFDGGATMKVMQADKKKQGQAIHFILLEKIGKALIKPVSFADLSEFTA
jgi:3-dehydroquinate synthase